MLVSLSIRNVVLIEKLDLSFDKGLCVFTGETGAGKSILLDGLSLALGARADTGLIRYGADMLSVSAEFSLPSHHGILDFLQDSGLDADTTLILRRTLSVDGKSKAFINDQPVSISMLKEVGSRLVEIHGQFASHSLLNPATHLSVLDAYGMLKADADMCRQKYHAWQDLKKKVSDAMEILRQAKEEEEYLTHAVKELQAIDPKHDEEEVLTERRAELMNAGKITEGLNNAYMTLSSGGSSTVEGMIRFASREIEKSNRLAQGKYEGLLQQLDNLSENLAIVVEKIESEADNFSDPTAELEMVEGRLFALKDLARKHRVSVDELPDILNDFEDKLSLLSKGQDELTDYQTACENARLDYLTAARELSQKRRQAGDKLNKAVKAELPPLKLSKAVFETVFEDLSESEATADGLDKITFSISTNEGIPVAPLHKVASGGELARFMLALKVNLTGTEDIETLIFDEVDSGIGGATASAVGQRLQRLSDEKQVLVITHSPQVAAFGLNHMKVSKKDNLTTIEPLTPDMKVEEIARMLSGAEITDSARMAATTLLEKSCLNS